MSDEREPDATVSSEVGDRRSSGRSAATEIELRRNIFPGAGDRVPYRAGWEE
jgi:hypothetical protein